MVARSNRSHPAPPAEHIQQEPWCDANKNEAQGGDQVDARLKNEYQAAVQANISARQHYDEIVARTQVIMRNPTLGYDPAATLDQRLELLREQKRHTTLIDLQDRLRVVRSSRVPVDVSSSATEVQTENPSKRNDTTALVDKTTRSIQALELAVVKAHYEAKKERMLLDRAKSSTQDLNAATIQSRLFAVSEVRRELTAWLEQSLARCQEEDGSLGRGAKVTAEEDDTNWEAKIDQQYEQYLESRRRLIAATAGLRDPLPEQELQATNGGMSVDAQPSVPLPSTKVTDVVNAAEAHVLPSMQQQRLSHAHLATIDEQLQRETSTVISMLDRLGHESQLLQAFPMLSHSGRFEHAVSVLGKKRDETRREVEDTTSKQLEPWLFAARAADATSSDVMQKHTQHGSKAMEAVARSLAELRLLKGSSR